MNKLFTTILLLSVSVLVSCKKDQTSGETDPVENVTKIAPDGFNFSTTKNITLSLSLKANNNDPLSGVVVSVYDPANTSSNAALYKGATDKNGVLNATITVPAYLAKVVIDPAYVGLMRNAEATINNNSVTALIGGPNGFGGNIVPQSFSVATAGSSSRLSTNGANGTEYSYPDGYTASTAFINTPQYTLELGRPAFLEPTGDVIDATLLKYINASLPESKPVAETHPEYLNSNAVATIKIVEKSDVWITFVSEGAGYRNTLAYYTYDTNNPPKHGAGNSANAISKITYVFPNSSELGSGGGIRAGDKVKLGRFDAGTSIDFVLIQDAWDGSKVNSGNQKFYSEKSFNPESVKNKHSIMLWDSTHKLFLMGFEDLHRENKYLNPSNYESDEDFNDLVVYATSNPVTGISNNDVPSIDKGDDADGDGVLDELDAFPNDASKAYVSTSPVSTVAFEDNWPKKGDFDLNDLVINAQYTYIKNAGNQVVELKGDYTVTAAGASFKNGFGVQFPFAPSAVQSVTGQKLMSNYITLAGNGVEAGQSKAVIIPFDNHDAMVHNHDYSYFINTLESKAKVTSETASVVIKFVNPMSEASIGTAPFNPFLISNLRRGYEIHLPGNQPTDKINTSLYKTDDDATNPAAGKYFLSKENWPWAISYNEQFNYPIELINIKDAYLHFGDWATSGGTSYTDWYKNTASGYRDASKIYNK